MSESLGDGDDIIITDTMGDRDDGDMEVPSQAPSRPQSTSGPSSSTSNSSTGTTTGSGSGSGDSSVDTKRSHEEDMKARFPLLYVPDTKLTPDQIKEKKKQKLLRAAMEGRIRKKQERDREKEIARQQEEEEKKEKESDPAGWLAKLQAQRGALITAIDGRKRQYGATKEGEDSMAAQLKKLDEQIAEATELVRLSQTQGSEAPVHAAVLHDRFNSLSGYLDAEAQRKQEGKEVGGGDSGTNALVQSGGVSGSQTGMMMSVGSDGVKGGKEDMTQEQLSFIREVKEALHIQREKVRAQQIELWVERVRVPEVLFQPSIAGIDQGGIPENIIKILRRLGNENEEGSPADMLCRCIYLTGGVARAPYLAVRLYNELVSQRPISSSRKDPTEPTVRVLVANNPTLDAWNGARALVLDTCGLTNTNTNEYDTTTSDKNGSEVWLPFIKEYCMTKDEWMASTPGSLKVHKFSNIHVEPPVVEHR